MIPHGRAIWPSSETQSNGSPSSPWFGRKAGQSPATSDRDLSTSPTPHYTRRRPQTPPPRVLTPTRIAGRTISAPLSNPTLIAMPATPPSPSLRTRQISAPHTNPTLTSETLIERSLPDHTKPGPLLSGSSTSKAFGFRRPSDTAIQSFFTMMLKSNHAVEIPYRNIDQKWQLVYTDRYLVWATEEITNRLQQASQDLSFAEESPEWYITKLIGKTINSQEVDWLHVSLRCNGAKWFQLFIDMQGSHALGICLTLVTRNLPPRPHAETMIEQGLVKCLQYIFNNKADITEVLTHDLIVSQTASALNSAHLPTLKLVTDVLTHLAHSFDEKTFNKVLRALDDLSMANCRSGVGLERYDYWMNSVVSILESRAGEPDEDVLQYMLSTFHLINGIVNHDNTLDARLRCRDQMQGSGLNRVVDIAKSYHSEPLDKEILCLQLLGQTTTSTGIDSNVGNVKPTFPLLPLLVSPSASPTNAAATHRRTPSPLSLPAVIENEADIVRPDPAVPRPGEAALAGTEGVPAHRVYTEVQIPSTPRLNIKKKRTQSTSAAQGPKPLDLLQIKEPLRVTPPQRASSLRSREQRPPDVGPPSSGSAPPLTVRRKPVPLSLINTPSTPAPVGVKPLVERLERLFADRGRQGEYRQLLACRKDSAQRLLNMFQRLLDMHETPSPEFRRELIVATQRLAGKSGLYPICYELTDITTIGNYSESSGGFADIYKGNFLGRPVCLKALRMNKGVDIQHFLKVFSKEAILWGQLSHPNLLPFYGIYHFRNGLSLVAPWMEYGDIRNYLKNHITADRVLLAFDIILGLAYLHANNIIHGDLKGPNILVDDTGTACLADFGLSSISDPNIPVFTSHSSAASRGGSIRWQAPELFDPESEKEAHNTVESDVYAFACVLYEIFVSKLPFFQFSRDQTVSFKIMNGERPTRPEKGSLSWEEWSLTENIWSLMQQCWMKDPQGRPTVQHITEQLNAASRSGQVARVADRRKSALSPAHFREMARDEMNHGEMSVETFDELLKSG